MQTYRIIVESQVDPQWQGWLEGMSLEPLADGSTMLTGALEDQAALFGLLVKLRDLGLVIQRIDHLDGPQSNEA